MAEKELVLTRVLNAPREKVFKAWTDPKLVSRWLAPDGFTIPVCEMDARKGGTVHIVMRGPPGTDFAGDFPMTGMFLEVSIEKVAYESTMLEDEKGVPQFKVENSAIFEDVGGGRTKLTVHAKVLKAATPAAQSAQAGMEQGWNQSLNHLANFVE